MASITDGLHKAAADALQVIGDVKWNIACTENAPPHLTDLDEPLTDIRMRINWLKEIKEEQWNSLWKPMPVHARETLNAIAETCKDLVNSCWDTNEDDEPLLRIRVLTSGWKKRRIFAHRQSLDVWQHSLNLINGTAKSCRDLESPLRSDEIRREFNKQEAYLRKFQDRSEGRWSYLICVYNTCLLLTLPNLKSLDEEDQQDVAGFDEVLAREIILLRAAEDLATKYRGTLKELHDALNEAAHGKKTCITAGDCCYCSRIDECVEVFRRGRFSP